MKIIKTTQGTDEWLDIRKGKITGTGLKNVMAKESTRAYKKYIYTLLSEEFSQNNENISSFAMKRGSDLEKFAVDEYQKKTENNVDEIGFCISDEFDYLGLSPDGFIGKNGAIEIKCPNSETHLEYIIGEKIPSDYKWQVVNYFLVNTNLEWLDFVSYDPRFFREDLRLFIFRITKDELKKEINEAREKIPIFRDEWEKSIMKII